MSHNKLNECQFNPYVKPEKFQYDTYRYQLYSKPEAFDCAAGSTQDKVRATDEDAAHTAETEPPVYDIRQMPTTVYMPILTSRPQGEYDITFPMTGRTLGAPDVSTACCLPVTAPGSLGGGFGVAGWAAGGGRSVAPPNTRGDPFTGVPDTLPPPVQRPANPVPGQHPKAPFQTPYPPPSKGIPNLYDPPSAQAALGPPPPKGSCTGQPCQEGLDDGSAQGVKGGKCMSVKNMKYADRASMAVAQRQETETDRRLRLKERFGSFGSVVVDPTPRRYIFNRDNVHEVGNGFHWDRPINENQQCYVLARNQRC